MAMYKHTEIDRTEIKKPDDTEKRIKTLEDNITRLAEEMKNIKNMLRETMRATRRQNGDINGIINKINTQR